MTDDGRRVTEDFVKLIDDRKGIDFGRRGTDDGRMLTEAIVD